ncbi:MAG: helix-turn-helix domain-containing protein, partial [Acidimicrobiales bacterium]
ADRQARRAATRLRALGALYAGQRAEQAARGELASPPDAASPLAGLSVREMEVLGLLTEGLTDREVGQRLLISAHTAHRHVSNILTKLGLPTRAAAAALAGRHGVGRSSAQRRPPVS